jgi:hypothetical protein
LGGSGLLAIWYNWRIEKERERLRRRGLLVEQWRSELLNNWDDTMYIGRSSSKYPFMDKPAYASLRPHLSEKFSHQLEASRSITIGDDFPRRQLIAEIGRIEREWQLV